MAEHRTLRMVLVLGAVSNLAMLQIVGGPIHAVVGALAVTWIYAARHGYIARRRAAGCEQYRRRARNEAREAKVEAASAYPRALEKLTGLVEIAYRDAPRAASYYELDDLLDRYAETAIACSAYLRQLTGAVVPPCDRTPPLQAAVRHRAVAWRQMCLTRAVACDEHLSELDELIHLLVARAIDPEVGA